MSRAGRRPNRGEGEHFAMDDRPADERKSHAPPSISKRRRNHEPLVRSFWTGHERISLGAGKSVALARGLYDFAGPVRELVTLLRASRESKLVYLPNDLLEKLYTRLALANPKGGRH